MRFQPKNDLQQPVLGAQFIELRTKASRRSGLFFKAYNGKKEGCLTHVRAGSKSLMDDPHTSFTQESVWSGFQDKIKQQAIQFLEGYFQARPKNENGVKECAHCFISDLCGLRRVQNQRKNQVLP